MYEQGTEAVMPSENSKEIESARVELCRRRPSGLTEKEKIEFISTGAHILAIRSIDDKYEVKEE